MTSVRYIVIYSQAQSGLDLDLLKAHPSSEVYLVDRSSPDPYDEIDMRLLTDLHRPIQLVFVGQELADIAETYWSSWIEDTPKATESVLAFWNSQNDDPWNLPTAVSLVQFKLHNRPPSG